MATKSKSKNPKVEYSLDDEITSKEKKSKNYCFTWHNYTNEDIMYLDSIECVYLAYGKEICPTTGTPHLQGFICFKNGKHFNSVRKLLKNHHCQAIRGSLQSNYTYCGKDGIFFQKGEMPQQGKRTDLTALVNSIRSGETALDDLVMDNPMAYHQYGRTLTKAEDIALRGMWRDFMTILIWIVGPEGSGKTHMAMKGFTEKTHYRYVEDNGWWEGYHGQEVVIMDDFRGDIKYNFLLQLADKYPMKVKRRNREPAPFLAKTIYITSVLYPHEVYCNLSKKDSLKQLYRRMEIIDLYNKPMQIYEDDKIDHKLKMATKCSEGNTKTSEPLLSEIENKDNNEFWKKLQESIPKITPGIPLKKQKR